jgi:hypothetical protein
VDGSLKVWDLSEFKATPPSENYKPMNNNVRSQSKLLNDNRVGTENRSDNDSGIDEREYRERRAQNMV